MSSEPEQAAVQAASDGVILNYITISGFVLLAYDSLLTLFDEVPYIWKKKWKLGKALYFLARYAGLLYILGEVISIFVPSLQCIRRCNVLMIHFIDALFIPSAIGVQGLLLARAYAVTDYKRPVLAILSILCVCAIATQLALVGILDSCDITLVQLHTFIISKHVKLIFIMALLTVSLVNVISIILFDTTVVAVTLAGTLGTWRVTTWNRPTLTHLLAEQSLLRFGFVMTITVVATILPLLLRSTLYAVVSPIQNSLSTIIICHFHLDLQRKNTHPNGSAPQDLSSISIRTFRTASQSIHNAVMAEFGGTLVDESIEAEGSREEVEPGVHAGMAEDGIELEGFQFHLHGAEIMEP